MLELPIMRNDPETTTLDTFGRILIPKPVRTVLDLHPRAELEISVRDGEIILTPRRAGEVFEQDGVLVWTGLDDPSRSIVESIEESRLERLHDLG
jgi:AbrB family looped-hinge helix DNA binding protein